MPIIQPNNTGGSLGSLGTAARGNQPSVDDLLRAAVAEGGALGDTAERLLNPKKSFFSTMSEKTWKTLSGFIDTVQTPMFAVAGILDPNRTIREAVEQKITPGDVLLSGNAPSKYDPLAQRAFYQITKFGVDTLLDPLTYLTFGAGRGLIGVKMGAEAFAGSNLAKQLGTKEGMRVYLSEAGEELADKYLSAQRNGLRQTFLKNERVKMVNQGLDEEQIVSRLATLEDEASDFLIKNTLDAKLDKRQAAQQVANLLEKRPHLASDFLDQGGIKFFGRSILSSQRVRHVKNLIPGMTAMDRVLEPVRNSIGSVFSTNYVGKSRLTDEYIDINEKWKNIYEAHRDRLSINGVRLKQQLNLSDNEWEFVTSAVENGLKPSDPRANDIWHVLHKAAPPNNTIRPEVWRAMAGVEEMNALARKQLVDSGVPVANLPNYMPHMLVKEKVTNVPFKPSTLKQTTNRTKFASVSAMKASDGSRKIVQFMDTPTPGETVRVRMRNDAGEDEIVEYLAGEGDQFLDENLTELVRDRATIQEARELGVNFEQNALAVALINSDEAIRVSTARHFIDEVKEKFGVRASQAPNGYEEVSRLGLKFEGQDLAKWLKADNGEPLMFNPTIAKHLQDFTTNLAMDEGTATVLRGYDALQNYFKAAVTSIFPAFHGRNALSNVFLAYNRIGTEALNPANHVATSNMLRLQVKTNEIKKKMIKGTASKEEYHEMMNQFVFKDKTGYDWTWGELRTQLIDNVVAFHHKNLGQTDQLRFGVNEVKEAAERMFPKTKAGKINQKLAPVNPFNTDNALFKSGFKVGQTIEDYSRTLLFMSHLKKTGDPIQAAREVKMALFDYSNLTKFEKNFMRRIVPFYSFSRKNLELQVKTLFTTPGRIAQQIRAVQSLGDFFSQDDLSEDELDKLPEWARKGYNVVADREGSHITLLRTLGTPLEELFNRADPKENLGVISPLIKAPIEMMSGYSFFHGRPISEVTQADAYQFAPEYIKDYIGYRKVEYTDRNGNQQEYHTSFAPWRMHMINNLQPAGRFFSEVNRLEKAPNATARFNALLFGFGTREFDLEQEELRRIRENEQALRDLLDQAGLGYQFEVYVPNTEPTIGDI